MALLECKNLCVNTGEKQILKGIDLIIDKGEIHVIMGPNGAGKSTLGATLMGSPYYEVVDGSCSFNGEDLLELSADKRAALGLFMSFQNPLEVPGITLKNFIRQAKEAKTGQRIKIFDFRNELNKVFDILSIKKEYQDRDLNVGFSGGEKKKAEIAQMLMLDPTLAILDETDSGLDVDAVKTVSKGVKEFVKNGDKALIIITHNTKILHELDITKVHVLKDGKIVETGDASLVDKINTEGFAKES